MSDRVPEQTAQVHVVATGQQWYGWRANCSCGWYSEHQGYRAKTLRDALRAGDQHMKEAASR